MKKTIYILVFTILSLSTVKAQNIIDTNTGLIENYFIQQQQFDLTQFSNKAIQTENLSDIIINQLGDSNNAIISVNQENKQLLTQQGNNNNFEYYTYYNNIESTITTTQHGDYNDIQIYGQNNLSKNMTINQRTNNQSIIVLNY